MTGVLTKPEASKPPTLDADVRMKDILKTLPRDVFKKRPTRAWTAFFADIALAAIGYIGIAISPWYLLPFLWVFQGTVLTGWFVLGHDAGHRSFSNRKWVNDLVGHIMFLPLIYPFHGWRIQHNYHHKHTNKLEVDNAWDPYRPEVYRNLSAIERGIYTAVRGRFWWVGSIGHWLVQHFNWNLFSGKQREQVRFSALFVIVAACVGFPLLIATTGIWGFVKFWLMPWMVYHFWMSTFTLVHHTLPEIQFQPAEEWNEARAQLCGTVHCSYPAWVEVLCHDINVHLPHHISTAIPWYNLRRAHRALKEHWGTYTIEKTFSWSLIKEITDRCHLYDAHRGYRSFNEGRNG
ncbi:fatty acid desaturase [Baaleninema simplex]|uniref:fatty acid desaturase n=1 Tax=Baaleninema simplex TaxID=2862350 RepID=UPI000346A827|nr:fatty acid desaturase [Baaleninema simplex]